VIKGSKDLDSSLVSNINLIKILLWSDWAQGQVTWANMAKKPTLLMTSFTKIWNPKPKNFFSLQTQRFATSFEGLKSSLAQSTGELWSCKVAWK